MTSTTSSLGTTLVLALLAAACDSGGGSGSSGGAAATDVGLTSLVASATPHPDLLSVEVTIDRLVLVDQNDVETPNLVNAVVTVDLANADARSAWLAGALPDPGRYEAVRARVSGVRVRLIDGGLAAVTITRDALSATLDASLVLARGDRRVVEVQWDLVESFEDSPAGGPMLLFAPFASASVAAQPIGVSALQGDVLAESEVDARFTVEAFADGERTIALGELDVLVTADTLLVEDAGAVFAGTADFFDALRPGRSAVEVHGTLGSDGRIAAERVELAARPGDEPPVVIAGRVLAVVPGAGGGEEGMLELLIESILSRSDIAMAVLNSIGDPDAIEVAWDAATRFYAGDRLAAAPELAAGQDVRVEFELFDAPLFLASEIEIQRLTPSYAGVVVDDTSRPDSIVVRTFAPGPLDLLVPLDGVTLRLDLEGRPALAPEHLVRGMRLRVHGTLDAAQTEIDATEITVHHGHLVEANVSGVDAAGARFTTSSSRIVQTFGALIGDGPLGVEIAPDAVFTQDAGDYDSFFALFENLKSDETLAVKVEGVGTGAPDRVVAFEVKAEVRQN